MNKFDLVTLKNEKMYKKTNLIENTLGIVVDSKQDKVKVLFFNPKNLGDFIITEVFEQDLIKHKEEISKGTKIDIEDKLEDIIKQAKTSFDIPKIKLYDKVKLLVEDKKYAKFGIHKNEIGIVVDDNAVQNYVEVDFENFDDSISVDMNDLEIIK